MRTTTIEFTKRLCIKESFVRREMRAHADGRKSIGDKQITGGPPRDMTTKVTRSSTMSESMKRKNVKCDDKESEEARTLVTDEMDQ